MVELDSTNRAALVFAAQALSEKVATVELGSQHRRIAPPASAASVPTTPTPQPMANASHISRLTAKRANPIAANVTTTPMINPVMVDSCHVRDSCTTVAHDYVAAAPLAQANVLLIALSCTVGLTEQAVGSRPVAFEGALVGGSCTCAGPNRTPRRTGMIRPRRLPPALPQTTRLPLSTNRASSASS